MARPDLSDIELSDDLYHACLAGTNDYVHTPTHLVRPKVLLIWTRTNSVIYCRKKADWPNLGTAVNAIAKSVQYRCNIAFLTRTKNLTPDEAHEDACTLTYTYTRHARANLLQIKKAIYRMIDEGHIRVHTGTTIGPIAT